MNMNDNYPPGAANDPNAPYNQMLDDDFTRTVSVSLSFDYTVQLPCNADEEWIKERIDDEVRELINKFNKEHRLDNFGIDELEVINE